MRSSCSLLIAAAVLAADPMEGVLLASVCSLSSSAAAFFSGSTYSGQPTQSSSCKFVINQVPSPINMPDVPALYCWLISTNRIRNLFISAASEE